MFALKEIWKNEKCMDNQGYERENIPLKLQRLNQQIFSSQTNDQSNCNYNLVDNALMFLNYSEDKTSNPISESNLMDDNNFGS